MTRRTLLGAAGATAVGYGTPALATNRTARRVAVLGGGMAGLAAAHELVERGFDVTVHERKALGGKARSMPVPGTGTGARRPLPGEHGFRFFPGFYHHVPDSMRRIPYQGNSNGVWDNLVDTSATRFSRADGEDTTVPSRVDPVLLSLDTLQQTLVSALKLGTRIPPHELAEFAQRFWVFLTSSDARRFGQWDYVSWWDFVRAEGKSEEYQKLLVKGLTRTVVAAKEEVASCRTIGYMGEAFLMNNMGRGNDGEWDRLLNAPTNEAWIDPWVSLLRERGVRFRIGHTVEGLEVSGGRISAARVRDSSGQASRVEADWFVCAMPVERVVNLWSADVRALDPSLESTRELVVDWMNGIQFYLKRPTPITPGHISYIDAPWALTSISQAQFWDGRDFSRDYGDGTVRDCLSVDISDWDTPGIVYGKPAKRCTREEVVREVWAQLTGHLNDVGEPHLRDADLHSWFLDPAITWTGDRNANDEPLLINSVGSWVKRPKAHTAIPNLFLSGDYVQTNVDLATMEGANESARAAVNALLDESGSSAPRAEMWTLHRPEETEALKQVDEQRYRNGQPNLFDTPPLTP
ncbi:MAG: NAD(P)-binding protein [Micromonosporaceae bacterium]|nr:NAD(P)-binding protein [Micromonosporaceae bacterium]